MNRNKLALLIMIIIVSVWMVACVAYSEQQPNQDNYEYCVTGEQWELCAVNAPSVY